MFGFGNKKRIEDLEEKVDRLVAEVRILRNSDDLKKSLTSVGEWAENNGYKDPCKECFGCRIVTSVIDIPSNMTVSLPSGDTQQVLKTVTNYIPITEAVEKIMDHLGLEFDHIDAKPSDTVIKPKETP